MNDDEPMEESPEQFDPDLDDPDDAPMWNCGCGVLVDGPLHCPHCGSCAPWGCGMDHDDDEDEDTDVDPSEQGIFEREMADALGPPIRTEDDDDDWRNDDNDDDEDEP